MCCGKFLAKYVLFFANLVFTLAGIGLIGLGIAGLVQLNDILDLIPISIDLIPISVIVIGCIVFVIAFFGCCGAIKESRCLLIMYSILMLILAALDLWLVVIVFTNLKQLQDLVTDWLTSAFEDENLSDPFHVLEVAFQCCGTTGANSYPTYVPPTCCAADIQVNNLCPADQSYIGCNDKVGQYFETFGEAIGAVALTILIVEVVAVVLSCFLSHSISSRKQKYVA